MCSTAGFERRLLATVRWTVFSPRLAISIRSHHLDYTITEKSVIFYFVKTIDFAFGGSSCVQHSWIRKAALGNSPVDCCNRRGLPAGKRILPPFSKLRHRNFRCLFLFSIFNRICVGVFLWHTKTDSNRALIKQSGGLFLARGPRYPSAPTI